MLDDMSDDDPRYKLYAPWVLSPGRASGDGDSSADFDKVLRDMAVYGAHAGAVIYPVSDRVTEELTKHYKKRLQTVADPEYLRGSFGDDNGKLGELYRELVENGAPADGSSCLHKISKLNNLDHFYNFAFKIPETDSDQKEADSDYKDWKQKFDESADKVFIDVLNSLVNEAERTLKIREILSQLETQPAGSE